MNAKLLIWQIVMVFAYIALGYLVYRLVKKISNLLFQRKNEKH